jgi:hypothetical protein
MNDRFIESCWIPLSYQRKPDTKGSYYHSWGQKGHPSQRLSMGIFTQRKKSARDIRKEE